MRRGFPDFGLKGIACALLLLSVALPVWADQVTKLYQQGYNAYHAQDFPAAVKCWSDVLALDPKDAKALANRALAYKELKEWDKAAEDAGAVIALTPDAPDGYSLRADIFHEKRMAMIARDGQHRALDEAADSGQAIADYTEAFLLASQNAVSPEQWIAGESGREGYNNIEKEIAGDNALLKLKPKDEVRIYIERGDKYGMLLWDWDKAIADFDTVLKIDPGNVYALKQRARYYAEKQGAGTKLDMGTIAKELADLSEIVRLNPTQENYLRRGEVYEREGDYDKAMADYQQAITLGKGRSPTAYSGIADIYAAKGDWKQAIENYNIALKDGPLDDDSNHKADYEFRASLYLNAGEYDKSIADVNTACEGLREGMKEIEAEYKNDDSGSDDKRHAMDAQWFQTWSATYMVERGEAWLCAGSYEKALEDFGSGIAADKAGTRGLNAEAWLQSTCDDPKFRNGPHAVEQAMKACELGGWEKSGDIDTLAAAYAESGKWDKAAAYEKLAVKVAQDDGKMPDRSAAMEQQQAELIKAYNARETLYDQKKAFRGWKELVDWEE